MKEIYNMGRREDTPVERKNQDLQIARAAKGTSEASKAQMQTKRGRGKMETQEGRLDAQSPTTTIERSSNPQRMCGPSCHSFLQGQRPKIRGPEQRLQVPRAMQTIPEKSEA